MANIKEKFYKLVTLLIILCFCFAVTDCKKNVQSTQDGWICTCGTENTMNFCGNCGKPKGYQKDQSKQAQQNQESDTKQIVSEEKTNNTSNSFANAKVGDYVKFGNYQQTANGDIQSIEWQVLAKENNKILVISKYGLDCKCFDSCLNNWKDSEIRKWLNGDFYNKAFNAKEKKFIKSYKLSDVGTTDKVFLLSKEEAEKYFTNNDARKCKATEYAVKNRAYVTNDNGCSDWWLRSPESSNCLVVYYVDFGGFINRDYVYDDYFVARPALWINI